MIDTLLQEEINDSLYSLSTYRNEIKLIYKDKEVGSASYFHLTMKQYRELLSGDDVLPKDQKLVGTQNPLYINVIWIAKHHRGAMAAKLLGTALRKKLDRVGCKKIATAISYKGKAFLEKLGFEQISVYDMTTVIMVRN